MNSCSYFDPVLHLKMLDGVFLQLAEVSIDFNTYDGVGRSEGICLDVRKMVSTSAQYRPIASCVKELHENSWSTGEWDYTVHAWHNWLPLPNTIMLPIKCHYEMIMYCASSITGGYSDTAPSCFTAQVGISAAPPPVQCGLSMKPRAADRGKGNQSYQAWTVYFPYGEFAQEVCK